MAKKHTVKGSLNSFIRKAEDQITAAYTAKLRKHAEDMGWPSDIISQIKVTYDGKSHQIKYPEGLKEQIMLLEYGDTVASPNPAIRTFMMGQGR